MNMLLLQYTGCPWKSGTLMFPLFILLPLPILNNRATSFVVLAFTNLSLSFFQIRQLLYHWNNLGGTFLLYHNIHAALANLLPNTFGVNRAQTSTSPVSGFTKLTESGDVGIWVSHRLKWLPLEVVCRLHTRF